MYVIREVLNCKPGKVRQMVEKFRSISTVLKEMGQEPLRLLTDVTGEPFWTIVAEAKVEKIDDFFAIEQRLMANETLRKTMADYHDLIDRGRREDLSNRELTSCEAGHRSPSSGSWDPRGPDRGSRMRQWHPRSIYVGQGVSGPRCGPFVCDPADREARCAVRSLHSEASRGGDAAVRPGVESRSLDMPLTTGTRLGQYEIVGPLGAGGMGEVYRARDTKLNRDVAVKVLPEAVASDRERLARFAREAQALAALNHPNIATIYGVEDGATQAIVMELVEGVTLAELMSGARDRAPSGSASRDRPWASGRLGKATRVSLPLDQALAIARQIADALEAAHERGIVHRDLKPANVKITPDGVVKVLDFGLAKAAEEPTAHHPIRRTRRRSRRRRRRGMIVGTAAYMSPEQAPGRRPIAAPTSGRSASSCSRC